MQQLVSWTLWGHNEHLSIDLLYPSPPMGAQDWQSSVWAHLLSSGWGSHRAILTRVSFMHWCHYLKGWAEPSAWGAALMPMLFMPWTIKALHDLNEKQITKRGQLIGNDEYPFFNNFILAALIYVTLRHSLVNRLRLSVLIFFFFQEKALGCNKESSKSLESPITKRCQLPM